MSRLKLKSFVTTIVLFSMISSLGFAGFVARDNTHQTIIPQQIIEPTSKSPTTSGIKLPITQFGPDRNQEYIKALQSSVKIEVFNEVVSNAFKTGQQLMGCTGTVISDYHILTASHCIGFTINSSIIIDWRKSPIIITKVSTGQQKKFQIRRVYNFIERETEIGYTPGLLSKDSDLAIIELESKIGIAPAPLPNFGQLFNPTEIIIGGGGKCENDLDYKHFEFKRCEQDAQFCYSAVNIQKSTESVFNIGNVNLTNSKPFYLCIEDSGGGAYVANKDELLFSQGAPILAGIGVRIWAEGGRILGSTILRIDKPSVLHWIKNTIRIANHPENLELSQKKFSIKSDEYVATLPGALHISGELKINNTNYDLVCTGTAIDPHHILIAAHCLQQKKYLDVKAWIGQKISLSLIKDSFSGDHRTNNSLEVRITDLWLHPSWIKTFSEIQDADNGVNVVAASVNVSDIAVVKTDFEFKGPFPIIGANMKKDQFANLIIGGNGDCSNSKYLYQTKHFRCERGLRGPCYAPVRVLGQTNRKLFADVANLLTQNDFYLCHGDSGGGAYLAEDNGEIHLESGEAVLVGVNDLIWDRNSITQSTVMVGSVLSLITPEVSDWIQSKILE